MISEGLASGWHQAHEHALLEEYLGDVAAGNLQKESRQEYCLQYFDRLLAELPAYTAAVQR